MGLIQVPYLRVHKKPIFVNYQWHQLLFLLDALEKFRHLMCHGTRVSNRDCHDEWMLNGPHSFTNAGNMRPPSFLQISTWIHKAWKDIPTRQMQS